MFHNVQYFFITYKYIEIYIYLHIILGVSKKQTLAV